MEGTICVLLPCQVNSSFWSDGTPDAVSHSLGQVSGAADHVERIHFWMEWKIWKQKTDI